MAALQGVALKSELTSALNDNSTALRDLVRLCVGAVATSNSRAAADLASPWNCPWWRGRDAIRDAHVDILLLTLAGLDHTRSLSHAIRTAPDTSVSLATMTRGGIEAFARAYWMITAQTPDEMLARDCALAYWDLEELARLRPKDSLSVYGTGHKVSPAQLREHILQWLSDAGLPKPARPGATTLTSTLIQSSVAGHAEDSAGHQAYSDLSAVSHAQSYAIAYFIHIDEDATSPHKRLSLQPNDAIMVEYTAQLHAAIARVGDTLIDYFRPAQADADRWITARDRSSIRRAHANLG